MVVETGTILDRGVIQEAQVADIVQALDQPLEVPAPVGVLGRTGVIEADAVAAEEVVGWVAVVKLRSEQEIDGLLPEIRQARSGRPRYAARPRGVLGPGKASCPQPPRPTPGDWT